MLIILQDALSGKHSYAYNTLKSAWSYRPHLVIVYSADVIVLVVCCLKQQVALPPLHLHTQLTLVREIGTARFPHLHNTTPNVITTRTWWQILCIAMFAEREVTKVGGFNDTRWVQLSLGVGDPFGAHDQIFLFFFLSFAGQLFCFSPYGAPSLTRRRVCNFQCNLSLVRVVEDP
jgi:hypothetical protein